MTVVGEKVIACKSVGEAIDSGDVLLYAYSLRYRIIKGLIISTEVYANLLPVW